MKLGMIDFYLDEWHANHIPAWLSDATGGEITVAAAYARIDSPEEGGRTTAEWCRDMNIREAGSIKELIEASDGILVLAPENGELHETLSEAALRSGKPIFIDKTFAPDYAAAKRMFDLADRCGTPCCTASSLRFASEYTSQERLEAITRVDLIGPNDLDTYSIHQLEPLVTLIGSEPVSVRYVPSDNRYTLFIDFADGKKASVTGVLDEYVDYETDIYRGEEKQHLHITSDFWAVFTQKLAAFLQNGELMAPRGETLRIMKIRTAGLLAMKTPNIAVAVDETDVRIS